MYPVNSLPEHAAPPDITPLRALFPDGSSFEVLPDRSVTVRTPEPQAQGRFTMTEIAPDTQRHGFLHAVRTLYDVLIDGDIVVRTQSSHNINADSFRLVDVFTGGISRLIIHQPT